MIPKRHNPVKRTNAGAPARRPSSVGYRHPLATIDTLLVDGAPLGEVDRDQRRSDRSAGAYAVLFAILIAVAAIVTTALSAMGLVSTFIG